MNAASILSKPAAGLMAARFLVKTFWGNMFLVGVIAGVAWSLSRRRSQSADEDFLFPIDRTAHPARGW